MKVKFVDAVIAKVAIPDQMDDWIDRWHHGAGKGESLHEFLGLTWDEYAAWLEGRKTEGEVVEMATGRRKALAGGK